MKKLALALLLVLPLASAKADVFESFNLNWSGVGNSASVSAVLTLNMTTLVANGYNANYSRDVSSLVMMVSGASSGNGTYDTADFDHMAFSVGTTGGGYGTRVLNSASQGAISLQDLNFFSSFNTAGTPSGSNYHTLQLASGQEVRLSAVPEPSSYVLGFAGLLGMVGFASSRKKKSEAAVAV